MLGFLVAFAALVGCLQASPARAQPAQEVRIVTLRAVADEMYRAQPGRIGREGRLECAALRRSSGSELLDRYVMSAVRLAQLFAALPAQIPAPSLPVSATFRFRAETR